MAMTNGYPAEADIDDFLSDLGIELITENNTEFIAESKQHIYGVLNTIRWAMSLGVYCPSATTFNVRGGKYLFKGTVKTYTPGEAVNPTDNDTTYIWMADDNTIDSGIDGDGWPSDEHIKLAEIVVDADGVITDIADRRGDTFLQYLRADVKKILPLPLNVGGGTADVEAITGAPSINLDTDGEIAYISFAVPKDWDGASDLTIKATVQNEIAETDGDDVDFDVAVHGIADGETGADAGQNVDMTLNLTGGDEAINKVNLVSGVIGYDHGTYPIAAGDTVVMKAVINLGGAGECTGPLHILGWWIEYQANKLGEAL